MHLEDRPLRTEEGLRPRGQLRKRNQKEEANAEKSRYMGRVSSHCRGSEKCDRGFNKARS